MEKSAYIHPDRLVRSFERHAFITWGKKETVVKRPAAKPIRVRWWGDIGDVAFSSFHARTLAYPIERGRIPAMAVFKTALHPFLVHVLIGLGFLYPLSRVSERFSVRIGVPLHIQARVLLVLFPIVYGAGFLARREFQPIAPHLTGRVDLHFTLGILTYVIWGLLLWKDSLRKGPLPSPKGAWIESALLLVGFVLLVGTATLGGQLVYGAHPLPTKAGVDPR